MSFIGRRASDGGDGDCDQEQISHDNPLLD
jgi:hypothetical protein